MLKIRSTLHHKNIFNSKILLISQKINCFVKIKKIELKLVNKLLTFPLLKRNNVHEDFLVILQFDWLSKTLFTLCINWPLYHCPRYHVRFTDFIRGNCQKYFSINKKYTGGRV